MRVPVSQRIDFIYPGDATVQETRHQIVPLLRPREPRLDAKQFDALATTVADSSRRRTLVGGLLGLMIAGTGIGSATDADAKGKGKKKKKKKKGNGGTVCESGRDCSSPPSFTWSGLWSGRIYSPSLNDDYALSISINQGLRAGNVVGQTTLPEYNCGGNLVLEGVGNAGQTLVLSANLTYGFDRCVDAEYNLHYVNTNTVRFGSAAYHYGNLYRQ